MQKKRLRQMSIKELEALRAEIDETLEEIRVLPQQREADIASDFNGDAALIHEGRVFSGRKEDGVWTMSLKIYCRQEHCPRCPHGWFNYRYWLNKKTGNVRIEYTHSSPALDPDLIEELRKHVQLPWATYEVEIPKSDEEA